MTRGSILLLLALVLASGCVEERRPASCGADAVTVQVAVTIDAMTPNNPGVCRGQEVTLVIVSDFDGIFHIHGYDAAVPATPMEAGDRLELVFTADRAGQFPIEIHPADDPRGVNLGIFTVYER